ncbi:hypothetical protein Golax_019158 [Gossypium laxum]|uniref:ARM repeat superfamily protein n=1 Tax=Gossypium laxum TaxID=34288 RepID=A0A7J8Z664_9ROSI|nr:hypothetical protein [Gossypium laxum]
MKSMNLNEPHPLLAHESKSAESGLWCESNNVKLPDPMKSMNLNLLSLACERIQTVFGGAVGDNSETSERSTHVAASSIETQVKKLVEDLKSTSVDTQWEAASQHRLLAKHNMDNQIIIANCGAISLLVDLLHSPDAKTQENAVTALLYLSINENNKTAIANANASL